MRSARRLNKNKKCAIRARIKQVKVRAEDLPGARHEMKSGVSKTVGNSILPPNTDLPNESQFTVKV